MRSAGGRLRVAVPGWAIMAAACAGAPRAPAPAAPVGDSRALPATEALVVFDSAWSLINRFHYDSTFNGVDWAAVREELRPRAAQAATVASLRALIQEMASRLGESHYGLIPHELADAVDPRALASGHGPEKPGDAGMDVRLVEGAVVVARVARGGPAAAAGIRPGWVVESIDGRGFGDALAALGALGERERRIGLTRFLFSANARLNGPAGSRLHLRLHPGSGPPVEIQLARRAQPGDPVRIGNLPTYVSALEHERIAHTRGCTGLIRFNVWMIPLVREFDRAVDAVRDCDGIVIDLRGNPGGVAGMVMGIAGHFLDEPVSLGAMRSRSGELKFVANPRRVSSAGQPVDPYDGPLAVLVDGMSASTSEFFAGGMQAIGRARVFGEATAGQALPAVVSRLPNEDVLMYVIADYIGPDGRRIEGRGVVPDVVVSLRRDDLLAGRDPVLDAALRWLAAGAREDARPPAVPATARANALTS